MASFLRALCWHHRRVTEGRPWAPGLLGPSNAALAQRPQDKPGPPARPQLRGLALGWVFVLVNAHRLLFPSINSAEQRGCRGLLTPLGSPLPHRWRLRQETREPYPWPRGDRGGVRRDGSLPRCLPCLLLAGWGAWRMLRDGRPPWEQGGRWLRPRPCPLPRPSLLLGGGVGMRVSDAQPETEPAITGTAVACYPITMRTKVSELLLPNVMSNKTWIHSRNF